MDTFAFYAEPTEVRVRPGEAVVIGLGADHDGERALVGVGGLASDGAAYLTKAQLAKVISALQSCLEAMGNK